MGRAFKILGVALYLAICAAMVWGIWAQAYRDALGQLTKTGTVQLEQATDRLLSQLQRFRQLPSILADHPLVYAALAAENGAEETNDFLLQNADLTGALDIYILDAKGTTVASSNASMARSFMGHNYAFRPYFQNAINGVLGTFHALGSSSGQRGFFFAGPIRDENSKPIGVIVVKVDLEALEVEWRADPYIVLFYDYNNVVFLANRAALVFKMYGFDRTEVTSLNNLRQYPVDGLSSMPTHERKDIFGFEVWHTSDTRVFPMQALALTQHVPLVDMTAQVFIATKTAQNQAMAPAILAMATLGLITVALLALGQRRRRLAERLAIEERANTELEARVERRSEQLRQVQDDLVQAGKLTALGEMSAGISHELNQPLAAIQNYAENGKILLERERLPEVSQNLGQISDLTGRMDRIIRNLRSFARKEDEPLMPVDIVQVIKEAVKLSEMRTRKENVLILLDLGVSSAWVMGGGVRLQQVLVNLFSNAMDAMAGRETKVIEINLSCTDLKTVIRVRDTGPGLNKPDRIFEPFYTTKSVDSGHGLGLGLSISYGLVQSFGGTIKGSSDPRGGALFTIELQTAKETS